MLPQVFIILAIVGTAICQQNPCASKDPQFSFFRSVAESAEIGHIIYTISVYGTDEEVDIKAVYNELFSFDPATRNVVVNATLDAERGQGETLTIICKVKTGGEIRHKLIITITDDNDHAPTFTSDVYNISIGEMSAINSRISTNIRASDDDETPKFNSVNYRIIDGPFSNYLVLENTISPNFLLAVPLNYETLHTFSFTLMALDYYAGSDDAVGFNSTCLVVVTVEDEDDQYPVFNSSIYRGVISSVTDVSTTINISPPIAAYDPDVTLNARVEYSFHDAAGQTGDYFDIDTYTGDITLVKRPTSNEIYLLVQATQEDNPSRYGVALLTIQVQGINVNAPVFTKPTYSVVALEDFPTGEVIASVLALDKDPGSSITYRLANVSNVFNMDPTSGDVRLKQRLSYSTSPTYSVFIEASDGDLTSLASLTVRVLKSNSHPPQVTNKNLTVSAKRNRGQAVIDIDAEDPDGQTSFSFTLLNHNNIFDINEDNGLIRIKAEAVDIAKNDYHVTVLISDGGQPSLDTAVIVEVHFPEVVIPVASASTGQSDDMIPIILGAAVAVLLILLIILIVFILRNRLKDKEHLDRAKRQHPSRDPRALAFKQNKSLGKKSGSRLDNIEFREEQVDGGTTIQENPLSATSKSSYFNFGQLNSDTEGEGEMDVHAYDNDIQVETSVIPFDPQHHANDDNNNDNIYNDSQFSVDSEDASNIDKNALAAFYRNGSLSTYPDSSCSDISINNSPTDSNNSKKGLVSPNHAGQENGAFWMNNGATGGASAMADVSNHIEMEPDTSGQPTAQKQELTVYF